MRRVSFIKWIGLILLGVALLAGGALLHPLVRFALNLHFQRFEAAQTEYASHLMDSPRLQSKASAMLESSAQRTLSNYYARAISYEDALSVLTALSAIDPTQTAVSNDSEALNDMETARRNLMQADEHLSKGEYAQAIPLYRLSLTADDNAKDRLSQAQFSYKAERLQAAEHAMTEERFEEAEGILTEAIALLGSDAELEIALADVYALFQGKLDSDRSREAHRLLAEGDARAAFEYVAACRVAEPDEYALTYLEQSLRLEYETAVCDSALSLQASGDPEAACAQLEQGLLLLDSPRMQALLQQIRATIPYLLGNMPMETETLPLRDQALEDIQGNRYDHSFAMSMGAVHIQLNGEFSRFTGTVAFPTGEVSDIYRASATLQIFGDGQLLAEFKDMDMTSWPIPFSLGVEGVQKITLAWTSEGANGQKDWGQFATVFDGRFLPPTT